MLAASSVFFALGLATLGAAHHLGIFLIAWSVIGIGMGAGLYDAAFATLGALYGRDARRAIVTLTLFGGFASTVCWPFSAFLAEHLGWRGACLVYAGIHAFVALPIHLVVLPHEPLRVGRDQAEEAGPGILGAVTWSATFVLTASAIALCSVISSVVSVHLLTILQDGGLTLAAAVSLGACVGPAQVGARVVEMAFGRFYHPIWTMLVATVLVTIGIGLLLIGFPVVLLALVLYGAGIGIESIARGALPLAAFGPDNYATLMGRIAFPSLAAQAVSPSLGALLLEHGGVQWVLGVLTGVAAMNIALVAFLFTRLDRRGVASAASVG